ncbi:MAG TPA: serine hydrolase domain-containing protein [Candidatus Binataceae bacterium]|nr:serine hydrolase domain-containing protein [Candidatus Binataceae bacterium]
MSQALIDTVLPRLTDRIHQVMTQQGVPGVSVGIVRDQELLWSGGFGYADLASSRAMDADTIFGIASITKTFTATAIMQLRDKDKLALDEQVTKYIPEAKKVRCRHGSIRDLTLRRLMTHRTGLVGETPTGHWSNMTFPSRAEIIAMLPKIEVVFETDATFKYNNLAFVLLGEVIARVSRRSYRDYIRRQILEPLGMESSGFDVSNPRNATGYMPERYQDAPAIAPDPPTNGYIAAAGLRSCVTDLAKWISLQLRGGADGGAPQVLSAKSLSEMHRISFVEPGWLAGYGLCWMASRFGENIYMHHGGSVPGFLSMVAFNKPHKLGVIVLTNKQGNVASGTIAFEALEMLVGEVKKEISAPASTPAPENLKPLLGRYTGLPAFGALFHIEWRRGGLHLVIPPDPYLVPLPPVAMIATDKPNVFIVREGRFAGEPLIFEFDADGNVAGFQLTALGGHLQKTD